MSATIFALSLWLTGPAGGVPGGAEGGARRNPQEGLSGLLGDNPGTWDPDEGPLTVWARSGSRSINDCVGNADRARNELAKSGDAAMGKESTWRVRAGRCPSSPAILRMAALTTVARELPLPKLDDAEKTDWKELDEKLTSSREQALAWLDDADREARRRGDPPAPNVGYVRAQALLALGRTAEAKRSARRALERGDVEPWRAHRLLALCAMIEGDLPTALAAARRAVVGGGDRGKQLSEHIYALVLDRAGDTSAARRLLRKYRTQNFTVAPALLSAMLPTHERLFFRALESQLNGQGGRAETLRLWKAYLERPEPHEAERKLAERHRAELGPPPDEV